MTPRGSRTRIEVDSAFHLCGSQGGSQTTCFSLKGLGGPCAPCPLVHGQSSLSLELDPETGFGAWVRVTPLRGGRFLCEREPLPDDVASAIVRWRDRNLVSGLVFEEAANKLQGILLASAALRRHDPPPDAAAALEAIRNDTERLGQILGLVVR